MDSTFGRRKPRPRQSSITGSDLGGRSIPYDHLAPSAKSPIPVSPGSSGFNRATGTSASITNPRLTDQGTELNIRQLQKGKAQKDRMYEALYAQDAATAVERQKQLQEQQFQLDLSPSPTKESSKTGSISHMTFNSSNSIAGSLAYPTPRPKETPSDATQSRSTTKSTMVDFRVYPSTPAPSSERLNPAAQTRRTSYSRTTDASTIRPRYASSVTSNGFDHAPVSSHRRDVLPTPGVRHSVQPIEGFHFPRPQNPENIEAMFGEVQSRLEVDGSRLGLEQKWLLVYNDAQIRWKEERTRQEQQRKSAAQGSSAQPVYIKDTPEWYLKKFLDQTITAKNVGRLTVSLRTSPAEWEHQFIELQGIPVLARTLLKISAKRSLRRDSDVALEYELLKCMKFLLNHESVANEGATNPVIISAVACSFDTPNIPSRRLVAEILTFMCYYNNSIAHRIVLQGLDQLSAANNETGRYDFWFRSLESTLAGRGRMGSLVGASEDIRKYGGAETGLSEYAQSNLILINGILTVDDFELRVHHRSQMEAAGLRKILNLCREFQHEALNRQIAAYQVLQTEDQDVLVRNFNEELPRDLSDPYDVYRAIIGSIEGTQAFAYFLSAMQHLLLIREEPNVRTRYYQLIDELVTSIVLDNKQNFSGGLQSAIGVSVSRLVAQFGEQDRAKELELQIGEVRRELAVMRLQKEGLEAEIRQGGEGLVGTLKTKLAGAEEKLKTS